MLGQTYAGVEYVIIDGASTDGTLDVVAEYPAISHTVSEPDRGIYDAMNKGLSLATGDWIIFMNAGDRFFKSTSVADAVDGITGDPDIVVGGVEIRYTNFKILEGAGRAANLWKGMQFSHQSSFIRRIYHQSRPYKIEHSIAADLYLMYSSFRAGARFQVLDQVISSVATGGISESRRLTTLQQQRDVVCALNGNPLLRLYFSIRALDVRLRSMLREALPVLLVELIIKGKRGRRSSGGQNG